MNGLETVRAGYGLAQLVAPGPVARLLIRREVDGRTRTVIRILGARHLAQAAVLANASPCAHRLGAVVDALHAVSMVGLALVDRSHRRPAWASAADASAFAAAEYLLHGGSLPGRHPAGSRRGTARAASSRGIAAADGGTHE